MEPQSIGNLTREDAAAGMKRLRSLKDTNHSIPSPMHLDETEVTDLRNLLSAVVLCDEWEDDDFDAIFAEDRDPVSIAFETAEVICRCGAEQGLPIIVEFFQWLVDEGDKDWLFADGPGIVATSSLEIASAWIGLIGDTTIAEEVVSVIVEGIERLAKEQPTVAEAIRTITVEALEDSQQLTLRVTTELMRLAVELKFYEAAEAIERAFSENRIDCGMRGDWEMVRSELHVEGKGLPMPEEPYNSLDELRRNVGVGCFSKNPLFLVGEIQEDAVTEYLDAACDAFAHSKEGKEVLQDKGHPFALQQFLELGVHYLGVSTDSMTTADAREILLELFPRKVSMDASECAAVTDQLVAFWKFCQRVHQLETAPALAKEVAGLRSEFRSVMSNPANFGMAKSFFMQGQQAGFDMTSQEGLNEFMQSYNASVMQSHRQSEATTVRNDAAVSQSASLPLDRKKRKKLLAKKQQAAKRKRK